MNKCSVFNMINIAGKKWSSVIIEEISEEKKIGFGKLIKTMNKISPKVLSQRLKQLEKEGLIKKHIIEEKGVKKISYELTEKGEKLKKIMDDLKELCMTDKKPIRCTQCPMY